VVDGQPLGPAPGAAPLATVLPALRQTRRIAATAQGVGLAVVLLFFHLILKLDLPALLQLVLWNSPLLLLLGIGGWLGLRRLARPLWQLADVPRGARAAEPDPETRPLALPAAALEAAQRTAFELPYRAAVLAVLLWLLLAAGFGVVGSQQPDETGLRGAGLALGTFVVSFGAAVYQLIAQRLALGPVLEELSVRGGAGGLVSPPAAGGSGAAPRVLHSLRQKMTLSFTALVFFACAFALFLSFVQSHELVDQLQARSSRDRVRLLAASLARGGPPELVEGEGLALFDGHGELVAQWGAALPPGQLPGLAQLGAGVHPLSVRGLLAAVSPVSSAPQNTRPGRLVLVAPRPRVATENLRLLIFFMSLMFLGAAGLVHLSAAEVTGPLQRLAAQAREMAGGHLERPVPVGEVDEIGQLAGAFERLRVHLKEKLETIEQLNATLEEKVRQRTAELEQALAQLQASEAKLVQSEKLAALGQLVAGVAHEINNPVNFILNTLEPLQELVGELIAALPQPAGDAASATADPAGGPQLAAAAEDVQQMIAVMRHGAERTRRIVLDLRSFSRLDEAELQEVALAAGIRSTLNLLRPSVPAGVQLTCELAEDPPVLCYAGQLNQVFMNLLNNAVQAVGPAGRVTVRSRQERGWAVVEVEDDGPGIPEGLRHRIFDPFFTTKEVGQGTGLGLSISLGIVARHGGELTCHSEVGQGTRFTVRIPVGGPGALPG